MTKISRKKPSYPVSPELRKYLRRYERDVVLPVRYEDLLHYSGAFPHLDRHGHDTLWETVIYPQYQIAELYEGLKKIYALLKTDGNMAVMEHLYIDRIDYCTFGNSNPFRVRVVNHFNDNYDYFYVKRADASRLYGLELEHILSPNRINYLVHRETLIEEHIAGIVGDVFIRQYLSDYQKSGINPVRLAKEFVKFNERCFVKLLGDMRSYNYVVEITSDFEDDQYRVRAIDFDQQCYEGRRVMYLPQFFRENNPVVKLCLTHLNMETMTQYRMEERTLMAKRLKSARYRTKDLIDCMRKDTLSTENKIDQLRQELAQYHQTDAFLKCKSMGDIVRLNLKMLLVNRLPKIDV
jgi:hypothetical protein